MIKFRYIRLYKEMKSRELGLFYPLCILESKEDIRYGGKVSVVFPLDS